MTLAEFTAKYRPRLLGYLAECYANRRCSPSDFGLEVDRQFRHLDGLLRAMFEDLQPPAQTPTPPGGNGKPAAQPKPVDGRKP